MKIVNVKTKAAYDIYIGRSNSVYNLPHSKWSNPFVIGKDGDRSEVISKYKKWVTTQSHLLDSLPELKGKTLGCWCNFPEEDCHGRVLLELLNTKFPKEKIRLSASKIKTLQNCSWLYHAQYNLKVPQVTNTGASRGLVAHVVLESLIKERRKATFEKIMADQKLCPSIEKLINKNAKKLNVGDDDNVIMIKEMVMTALKYDFFCAGAIRIEGEAEFRLETENYLISGFIDRRAYYPDGTIKITDYKSSKKKFSEKELDNNMQGLMYSLATYKEKNQIPKVEFQFLRFPKQPLQEFPLCTKTQLKGFESFLESISLHLQKFNEKTARLDMAVKDKARSWLCGKEGNKLDGTPNFICQYRKPSSFYALKDSTGKILQTSFKKEELLPKEGQKISKLYYEGCPAFKKKMVIENDPFDF